MGNGSDSETNERVSLIMSYTEFNESILDDVGTLYFSDEVTSCDEVEESALDDIFGSGSHFVIQSQQTETV
tara:strand:+ start:7 stop:219 length:213 start_codon:yes stop_codon:yes gene_type:complete